MKVYVETALSDSYPRIKGIRSRANFIRNIVSRYLERRFPGGVELVDERLPAFRQRASAGDS